MALWGSRECLNKLSKYSNKSEPPIPISLAWSLRNKNGERLYGLRDFHPLDCSYKELNSPFKAHTKAKTAIGSIPRLLRLARPLWASLKNDTVNTDRHENHRQFRYTVFDWHLIFIFTKQKVETSNHLKKQGDTEKPHE